MVIQVFIKEFISAELSGLGDQKIYFIIWQNGINFVCNIIKIRMKKFKLLFALLIVVSFLSACGSRKDRCPSVEKGTNSSVNNIA